MGSDTMDLSKFCIHTGGTEKHHFNYQPESANIRASLNGELAPGKSYVFVAPKMNYTTNSDGTYKFENNYYANLILMEKADTVFSKDFNFFNNYNAYSIWYNPDDTTNGVGVENDSYLVDIWNFGHDQNRFLGVAGIAGGASAMIYARKYIIKDGIDMANKTWNESRSDDISTSEWLPIPQNKMLNYDEKPFTSIGSHGSSTQLDIKSSIATIDLDQNIINFPYGYRRDSLIDYFEIGPNHAWFFKNNGDTSQYFLQDNDTLNFYVLGDTLAKYTFSIKVEERSADFTEVSPLIYKNASGVWTRNFVVSKGFELDSIGGIEYDLRVDSLLKYIKIEENCTYEIIYSSGKASNDIKYGDILRIKSKDGQFSKDYLLAADQYYPNHSAELEAIIFSGLDLWENPETFMYTDTMLSFTPASRNFSQRIPSTVTSSPAVYAIPKNVNTKVLVEKASNLNGSVEERTITITCTAEDDTTIEVYTILLIVEREAPKLDSEVFISDYGFNAGNQNHVMMQVFNPFNEEIDMGQYVLFAGSAGMLGTETMNTLFADSVQAANRLLRPGYMPVRGEDLGVYWEIDYSQTKNKVLPSDEYIITSLAGYPFYGSSDQNLKDRVNFEAVKFANFQKPRYGHTALFSGFADTKTKVLNPGGALAIFKVTNDSIADGTKSINNFEDYELVDVIGSVDGSLTWNAFDNEAEKDTNYIVTANKNTGYWIRKPWVYKGNSVGGGSFGRGVVDDETAEITVTQNGEWTVTARNASDLSTNKTISLATAVSRFDNHVMETYVNVTYVLSDIYLVEPGYEGNKGIYGISANTTVTAFMDNIILLDTGMVVELIDAEGRSKTDIESIVSGDKMTVTNALGSASIVYTLDVGALDSDVSITSSVYSVENDGVTGTLSDVPFGITLEEVLDNISWSDKAKLVVLNSNNEVISTTALLNDSNAVVDGYRGLSIAVDGTQLEVNAQDGITKRVYVLSTSSDKLVLSSNVYTVDQEEKFINYVSNNTSVVTLLRNLFATNGASLKVYSSMNNCRETGAVKYNDIVYVINAEGTDSVYYNIKFTNEEGEKSGVEVSKDNLSVSEELVFPNPASNMIVLPSSVKNARVFDLTGKLVLNKALNGQQFLKIQSLSIGVYLLKMETADGNSRTSKIIKE